MSLGFLRSRWAAAALFALLAIASLAPIWSNDYFWHLATGRWIVEHRALPLTDPFGVASDPVRWINGEWLFQVVAYPLWTAIGHAGLSVLLAIAVAALFALSFRSLSRDRDAAAALLLTLLAWYLAVPSWFTVRPSAVAAILLVAFLAVLRRPATARRAALAFLVALLWMNVHPSALIAPVVAGLFEIGDWIRTKDAAPARRAAPVVASAAALLVTPWGIEGVLAPLRLVHLINTVVQNQEWLPTTLERGGFFYATVALAVLLFAANRDRLRALPEALVLALLTLMAIRYVRNHLLYYAALPILAGSFLPRELPERLSRLLAFAAAGMFAATLPGRPWSVGIDESRFPVEAVARLEASGIGGTIYNSNRYGGYLIWTFYPEKRAIQDGRNELYVSFLREWARAQVDSRAWKHLLDRYGVRVAVVDYREPPLEVVDAVTGERKRMPRVEVFFPRTEWKVLAADRAAVVLARR